MRYYLIGGDGKTYGPADGQTLQKWAREGRVNAGTILREEEGGAELRADLVPELAEVLQHLPHDAAPLAYPYRPCPNCGSLYDPASRVCPNCGAAGPAAPNGRLVTGNAVADGFLGFVVGFFSWFLYVVGAIALLILYFSIKRQYPAFARGILMGLFAFLVIMLGLFALCLAGMSHM